MTTLLLALCGGAGALARFVTDASVRARIRTGFPLGTLLINVLGSFALGVVTGAAVQHAGWLPSAAKAAIGTGFCGGFTTFSTASVETARLWIVGDRSSSTSYAAGSAAAGLLGAGLGLAIGAALG